MEMIIYKGKNRPMSTVPYLDFDHPRIKKRESRRDKRGYQGSDLFLNTSACHRGYCGYWHIIEDRLILSALAGKWVLDGEPVFADWYSGQLLIADGNPLRNTVVTMYEREICLQIDSGIVVAESMGKLFGF